ncbi:universal stress protein PHOS32-like [Chenopodium quinoa]|uniref:UspA domain-containing protein n=1 Tax=Chenopodium quinoa TaxID=63459 RepID=A0A803LF64_CHEQI|nr:universal stress protein PHOS32-like [Chenopodium quinoa]
MEVENRGEKKIVVAVDESEESMHALSWCLNNVISVSHQNSNSTTLVLLYVKPPPPANYSAFDVAGYLFGNDVVADLEDYYRKLVDSVMSKAQQVCMKSKINIKVEKKVGSGDAKDVICGTVEKLGADMLVMGSHGYGFLKRAILGSVSYDCAKQVKCPMVVVKHPKNIS